MSRQRGHTFAGKTRYFIAHDPHEKARLSEFINGIKQYQDEEFKAMRAEFDRVERLLASDKNQNLKHHTKGNNVWETRSLPADRMRMKKEEPQSGVWQKDYRYVRWTFMFCLIIFFFVAAKLCIGRLANSVATLWNIVRK